MTFSLGQALAMLELPQAELASWLLSEIEKNPLLELEPRTHSIPFKDFAEIEAPKTLYDHLLQQIRERFSSPEEQSDAIHLLENLDERGFLAMQPPDCQLLATLQTFDPPGIFARDLRECLLLQLDPGSFAYKIVSHCFEDLLHGRFTAIRQKTGIGDLASSIQTLSRLNARPADLFRQEINPPIIVDLTISKIDKTWVIESNDEELPKFHIRSDYLSLSPNSPEEKESLCGWATSGKWLLRSMKRRKSILLEIGVFLVKKQASYLEQKGDLQPLSIQELSESVHLHESTLSRALSGKYAKTPRGLIPLRSLLSTVSDPAKIALQKLIAHEDKKNPLSDEKLAALLETGGMKLARRTIAKYRAELKISPASRRKYLKQKPGRSCSGKTISPKPEEEIVQDKAKRRQGSKMSALKHIGPLALHGKPDP
jgi:RNA polymerase sigma-54 factor